MHSNIIARSEIRKHEPITIGLLQKISQTLGGLNVVKNDNYKASYIDSVLACNKTVIDIGSHTNRYLYKWLGKTSSNGKLILFEENEKNVHYFKRLHRFLNKKNIAIETASYFKTPLAEVIPINEWVPKNVEEQGKNNSLDNYCLSKFIEPGLIIINAADKQSNILNGALKIIATYKPVIMIQCDERVSGRKHVLETFNFFTSYGYRGYFILDTIKIPLNNFDFNLYQNTRNNFYCDQFIFEKWR